MVQCKRKLRDCFWSGRLKEEQEAREKAESAWKRSVEAKVAWEAARRAHEVARNTLRREEVLADIAREQSCISRAREQAASAERRTNPRDASAGRAGRASRLHQQSDDSDSQSHPVIPDDDGMLALVSFLSDGQQDSQIPE